MGVLRQTLAALRQDTAPVSIAEAAWWDPWPVWTSMEKRKSHLLPHQRSHFLPHQSSNLGPLHRLGYEFFKQCRVCSYHIPLSSVTANCGSCKLEISNEPGTQWVFPILWRRYSWRLPFCSNSQCWQRTRILAACFPARLLVPQGLFAPLSEFRCVFSTQNTSRSRNHLCSTEVPHFTSISRKTASQFRDLCSTVEFPNSYFTSTTNARATILISLFTYLLTYLFTYLLTYLLTYLHTYSME